MLLTKHTFCRIAWKLTLIGWLLGGAGWLFLGSSGTATAQSDCSVIYEPNNGWLVELCTQDSIVTTPMEVVLDGISQGQAAVIRIYHQSEHDPGLPQVAVFYANGFIRLKQNADPSPSNPFGGFFILGPAYWPAASTYHHHPQLTRLELDTSWLPTGPLRLKAQGHNHNFAVAYELTLPPPRDHQTRLHVTQTYTATAGIIIDSTRQAEAQGLKLVQIASMFINEGGSCEEGQTDCHDSNAVRFIGSDLMRHQAAFTTITPSSFVFSPTIPLGSTWFDALHTDDQSWHSHHETSGNTPNLRIALDVLPLTHTITPQGWISATTNPKSSNVNLWVNDDDPAAQSWTAGQSDQVGYWLLAQDNPPEPWTDLGLRSGETLLDFEGEYKYDPVNESYEFEAGYKCFVHRREDQSTSGVISPITAYTDHAIALEYDLGSNMGNYAQIRCDFETPRDLSSYDHLRLDWRGAPLITNSLQLGLINPGSPECIFFTEDYHSVTQHSWWGQLVAPFNLFAPSTDTTGTCLFDPKQVSAFFISTKVITGDRGGVGTMAIDNVSAYSVSSRPLLTTFETVNPNITASTAAVNWLASRQQATGLLKSWEESACNAWLYDQALALIVLAHAGRWAEADILVDKLVLKQEGDGAWFEGYDCTNLEKLNDKKWEGAIAWTVYALSRYLEWGGSHSQAITARDHAANWLVEERIDPEGCLFLVDEGGQQVEAFTEPVIDAWWALQSAGPTYAGEANGIKNCLLNNYWDEQVGYFKSSKQSRRPYLDNQTWGAAFLNAIGEEEKAQRALSYAKEIFLLPAQSGQLFGFDGNAGPWSVWNEGTAQYVAGCSVGANDLLPELLAQQREDGAMPGSPDEFTGGGVWTTRWHGVAPTAWLYYALHGEPFHPSNCRKVCWLPVILKQP